MPRRRLAAIMLITMRDAGLFRLRCRLIAARRHILFYAAACTCYAAFRKKLLFEVYGAAAAAATVFTVDSHADAASHAAISMLPRRCWLPLWSL